MEIFTGSLLRSNVSDYSLTCRGTRYLYLYFIGGPHLANSCLTDHRTWFNLQAFASHVHTQDWQYHHDLPTINRLSLLYNYLGNCIEGRQMYYGWVNGSLYKQTSESFGISPLPGVDNVDER